MRKQLTLAGLLLLFVTMCTFNPIPPVYGADISLDSQTSPSPSTPRKFRSQLTLLVPLNLYQESDPTYQDTTVLRESGYHSDGAAHMSDGFLFNIANTVPLFRIHPAIRRARIGSRLIS